MSSTLRRILASRANGARSKGPKTEEGKRRSSQNAIRHGLLANQIVLSNEDRRAFEELVAGIVARFGPVDVLEYGAVEEMAAAYWRQRRAWAIETRLLDDAVQARVGDDELGRICAAFRELSASPDLRTIQRYETRLNRIFQRALYNLLLLRAAAPLQDPDSQSAAEVGPVSALPPAAPAGSNHAD